MTVRAVDGRGRPQNAQGSIERVQLDAGGDEHDHLIDPAHRMHLAMVKH